MSVAMTNGLVEVFAVEVSYDDVCEMATCGAVGVCRAIITTEVAKQLLQSNNIRNRGYRKSQLKMLVNQLRKGKFVFNGETVVFGDDGNLNNGQHRLQACVTSGKTIEVLLVFGIPKDHFVTYDQVARRSCGDVLSVQRQPNAVKLAAALRQIDNYHLGAMGKSHAPGNHDTRGDNSYVLELREKYPGVDHCVRRCSRMPRHTSACLAAALYYLFSQVDEADADDFFRVVCDELNIEEQTNIDPFMCEAGRKLRQWLSDNHGKSARLGPVFVANIWIKAWNAYRTGKIPKIYKYQSNEGQVAIERRLIR